MFLKISNIHRETLVLESFYNNFMKKFMNNFMKKKLQHRCIPVSIAKFIRAPILKNI